PRFELGTYRLRIRECLAKSRMSGRLWVSSRPRSRKSECPRERKPTRQVLGGGLRCARRDIQGESPAIRCQLPPSGIICGMVTLYVGVHGSVLVRHAERVGA